MARTLVPMAAAARTDAEAPIPLTRLRIVTPSAPRVDVAFSDLGEATPLERAVQEFCQRALHVR